VSTTDRLHEQQIIIVRRSGELDEGHHGGAWKIAFADFMTAMMAFFLVMWLTSVSDDATKKQIAQYFNPIELNSDKPPSEGLTETDSAPSAQASPAEKSTGPESQPGQPGGKPVGGTAEGGEDQALFRDPYAVLAEIVADAGPAVQNGMAKGKPNGSGLPGLNGGDAYRDPFDPTSWQLQPNMLASADAPAGAPPVADSFATVATPAVAPPPSAAPSDVKPASEQAADAAKLQSEIRANDPAADVADVKVTAGDPGTGTVTISLADTLDTGMFQIGSAKPTADAIRLMEKIAAIVKDRPGTIVIRGHTDARPFAGGSGETDNWRLSTSRAHMAYYMLMRGGLDDRRVEAIEGVADRQPSNARDPEAASNRRIEILLKEPKA
jgi:chemotaxis protein MotB